jgi:hypothetical protein
MELKNKQLEELLDIFESELREILKKYIWESNTQEVRSLIIKDIQQTFFDNKITAKAKVIDNTTPGLVDMNMFDFKIKEGRKKYTFVEYIEKIFITLNSENNKDE